MSFSDTQAETALFGPDEVESLQRAIQSEGLDGWLFCNFRHRDKLSDEILRIPGFTNSRFWFYAVPARGEPLKIIHSVEPDALDTLPGKKAFYVSREDLKESLSLLAGKTWGVHSSRELAAVSFLDAGTAAVLEDAGLRLVSAAALIQRFKSLLDAEGIGSHERAAVHLYEIVKGAWNLVKNAFRTKKTLFEGDVRRFMLDEIAKRNLVTEHELIVAAGPNSGNPHYGFTGSGAQIREGDVIQFDLWAKEKAGVVLAPRPSASAIFADISWAGIYAAEIPGTAAACFDALVNAREGAVSFIQGELDAGRVPAGEAVDRRARQIIADAGFAAGLKHRTGHGIDSEIHGSGVNIDSVEFPDSRLLLEGSCFSIEPGIYFPEYGMRTEINVYIRNGKAFVSGRPYERQFALLSCG